MIKKITMIFTISLLLPNISFSEPIKLHTNVTEDSCNNMLYKGKEPTVQNEFRNSNTKEKCNIDFVSGYTTQGHVGLWSAQHITKDDVKKYNQIKRESQFNNNDSVIKSYKNSGYDRGHLTPSSNSTSLEAQKQTFTWENIAPQNHKLNNGRWKRSEILVKNLTLMSNDIYVVTGVLFNEGNKPKTIGEKEVIVPDLFWKAVLAPSSKRSFVTVCPNSDYDPCKLLTVDQFKKNSGIDPFPGLTEEAEGK